MAMECFKQTNIIVTVSVQSYNCGRGLAGFSVNARTHGVSVGLPARGRHVGRLVAGDGAPGRATGRGGGPAVEWAGCPLTTTILS